MKRVGLSLYLLLFLSSSLTFAKDTSVNLQYAGEIGKFSVGIGQRWSSWYELALHYGVVPKEDSIEKIETYALKNYFYLYDYEYKEFVFDFYIGVTGYYVPHNKYKTDSIKGAPKGYYRQSSYRGILSLGVLVVFKGDYALYYESGVNDVWLNNKYNNSSIDLSEHISSALGLRWYFF